MDKNYNVYVTDAVQHGPYRVRADCMEEAVSLGPELHAWDGHGEDSLGTIAVQVEEVLGPENFGPLKNVERIETSPLFNEALDELGALAGMLPVADTEHVIRSRISVKGDTESELRNGYVKTAGVSVETWPGDGRRRVTELSVVTSKGAKARGGLMIPTADLPAVIKTLISHLVQVVEKAAE